MKWAGKLGKGWHFGPHAIDAAPSCSVRGSAIPNTFLVCLSSLLHLFLGLHLSSAFRCELTMRNLGCVNTVLCNFLIRYKSVTDQPCVYTW